MNVNGITTPDGDSQSVPHPSSPPYPHQHHESIMEYDYLWAANHYNSAMGSDTSCDTGRETIQKQQQHPNAFQGQYPLNKTTGSSELPPVTREQYLGLEVPGQQQGGMPVTIRYSHGMYGVYPNQVHTGISLMQHQQPPTVLHQQEHQQQPPSDHLQARQEPYDLVLNGVPCYQSQHAYLSSEQSQSMTSLMPTAQIFTPLQGSPQHSHINHRKADSSMPVQLSVMSPPTKHGHGSPQRKQNPGSSTVAHFSGIQVCRNNSHQVLDQDYSGTKRTTALQQPSTSDTFSVKASGTSLEPTNDHNLQVQQSLVNTEPAKVCHDMETTFKELSPTPVPIIPLSMATGFPQNTSEPTVVSPQRLSAHASIVPNRGTSTTSALVSTPQLLTTSPLKVQTPRPHVVSLSPPIVTVPGALSTSISPSPQISHVSSVLSPGIFKVSQNQSFALPSKISRHNAFSPIVENQDSRGLQVTQSALSQSTHHSLLSGPSSSFAPAQRVLGSPPKFPGPQTIFLTDKAVDNSILCSSTTSSSSVFSKKCLSAQKFSELPLAETNTNVLSSYKGPGHTAFHESAQQTIDMSFSTKKNNSISEVSWTHQKVSVTSSVCKQEGHTHHLNEALNKTPESSLSIPAIIEPEKDFLLVVKNDRCSSKEQASPGKGNDNPTNDVWDTNTKKCMSLAGIVCVNRSDAVDYSEYTQGESFFISGNQSISKCIADILPENDQTDTPYDNDAKDLTAGSSNDAVPLKDNSKIHNSLDDTAQPETSENFSSFNEFFDKFNKVADTGGQGSACTAVVDPSLPLPTTLCSKTEKAACTLKIKKGSASPSQSDTPKRRIASEEQVIFPLMHGWRREIRVRKLDNRLKGETWYYTPCGRRMKQFPEVIKYLKRHEENLMGVTREHFSFSPRMPVGDFYEERETPEGKKWFLLANEEVPSMIMAITGRRGRPPNPDKEVKLQSRARQLKGAQRRRPGRPPKLKFVDLLSKIDARMLKRLEEKEELTEEDKVKLTKIKKKMKKKARLKRMKDANNRKIRQEKLKAKSENGKVPVHDDQAPSSDKGIYESVNDRPKQLCSEMVCSMKRTAGARSKAKALAKAKAEAEAQQQAALAAKRQAERRANAKRRLEERKRQQKIIEELKKPTEDMCLTDQMPLPELSRIPGLVLSGVVFSHCITVVEFLHSYGKVLGLQVPKDIPNLTTLQEGLLGLGKSQSELLDLLINLVSAVLQDPGLPSYYQSVKILGEKLVDLELHHSTVSEVLRIFLESHSFDRDICNSLRTRSFETLNPEVKASILAFLVEELNASKSVMNEIDKTLENMTTYKKNKWIIEGKLRKIKAALARKTGRSEEELGFEDRRRSTRVCLAGDSFADSSLLENDGSHQLKDELKMCQAESSLNSSVPELERQIEKLTKRQDFFRKKLLQSSHSMRAMSLGQDRYQRRYWLLPNIGGVLVEGPEEILASEDILIKDEPIPFVDREVMSFLKKDNIMEPHLSSVRNTTRTHLPFCLHPSNIPPPPSISPPADADPLPGEASLMSSSRGWGRPRKIRPEVELHLRTVKNRRRRQNKTGAENRKGDSQSEDFTKEQTDRRLMSPKELCTEDSLSPCSSILMPSINETPLPLGTCPHLRPVTLAKVPRPGRRCRKGGGAGCGNFEADSVKRSGRPSSSPFQEKEQKYLNQLVVKPIPREMVKGWWWIRKPAELTAILTALHPRGIREKVLCKNLTKHMEFLTAYCTQPMTDPIFHLKMEDDRALLEVAKQPWVEQKHALQIDISILQMVEYLEQRVLGADLQLKIFTAPDLDSTREDLKYCEHEVDPSEDWMLRSKKERWDLLRVPTNPLDLAVMRLTNLERNIERRYLKGPLWNLAEVVRLAPLPCPNEGEEIDQDNLSLENEITPRLRTWRQALDRCRSASQLSLCLLQLERAIAWEKSIIKVTCQLCRKGDNDACLLLCDGCDRGWHMFCLRPKVTRVPEGDWFCPACNSQEPDEDSLPKKSARQRAKAQKRRPPYGGERSTEKCRNAQNMTSRQKNGLTPSTGTSYSLSKRRRMATRNQPDLTYCEIILMEMEAHPDAWPFLEPVNPRLVPGYRRIIKNPMDFLTMREKLLKGGYCTCEEFAADAQLVFNNCELFNEDTSEVGMAGHSMRRFFESRWAEFYSNVL
ncbi:bromodomain adjacent to zinc finger domain protein 2A isoform X2 [Clarias gariepinus]|uniref:bromodomain adjacent to zinc finger domain protein 2A isoform X2 n=1 Tax=Clarias gariepinus TaxID=13013 RepID=UPI00234C6E00|nr:bromodomain adjacent to zinc finger domain protein 2A isoform X2 [Clarias gariepinus]